MNEFPSHPEDTPARSAEEPGEGLSAFSADAEAEGSAAPETSEPPPSPVDAAAPEPVPMPEPVSEPVFEESVDAPAGENTPEAPNLPPESSSPTAEAAVTDEDEGDEDQAPVWVPEPDKLLLSLLFASQEYLDARALREIMGPEWDTPRLRQLVRKLNRELDAGEMPLEITETEGTFRLRTLAKFYPWTRRLFKDSAPRRLSQAALETLAIVAYKQPVTKAEIESIRGVNVDGSMKTLLDKRLIDIGRRSDTLGQAFTYHTTREFMRYFGINRVPDDLPRLSEFEGILNAQTLIPQMGPDGEIHEMVRDEETPDAEQLTLGMGGETGEGASDAP